MHRVHLSGCHPRDVVVQVVGQDLSGTQVVGQDWSGVQVVGQDWSGTQVVGQELELFACLARQQ